MKKLRLLSLVGITSIALTHAAWAGPNGGGGGGFGGGGGHGGGGGAMSGGGRGGGVGFGLPTGQLHGGVTRFSGGGPRFAGRAGTHISSGPGRVTNSRPAFSNVPRNRGLNGRTGHIAERHDANWHGDWDRRHAHFDHGRFFIFIGGFWCGLDDEFFPWDYLPYYADDYYPYDYYADAPSYGNTEPVYNNGVMAADPTVQAVQTQLTQLGYYNGPVDGIFGPTTRDAVAKYQIANNLDVTGSLSPNILQSLGLPQATGS